MKIFVYAHTTGVTSNDEIIEIGVVDEGGSTLLNQRFKPFVAIEKDAVNAHGITAEMLQNEPALEDKAVEILELLTEKEIYSYTDLSVDTLNYQLSSLEIDAKIKAQSLYDQIEDASSWSIQSEWSSIPTRSKRIDASDRSAINRARMTADLYRIEQRKIKRKEQAIKRRKLEREQKRALIPENPEKYHFFGRDERPKGCKTLSQLKLSEASNYRFGGMCCDNHGNRGYLFVLK